MLGLNLLNYTESKRNLINTVRVKIADQPIDDTFLQMNQIIKISSEISIKISQPCD